MWTQSLAQCWLSRGNTTSLNLEMLTSGWLASYKQLADKLRLLCNLLTIIFWYYDNRTARWSPLGWSMCASTSAFTLPQSMEPYRTLIDCNPVTSTQDMSGRCLSSAVFWYQVTIDEKETLWNIFIRHSLFSPSIQCNALFSWIPLYLLPVLCVAKYNESETDVPHLETLEYLIQLPIPKDTLLNYELWTLQKLGWKLNGTDPLSWPFPLVFYTYCTSNMFQAANKNNEDIESNF